MGETPNSKDTATETLYHQKWFLPRIIKITQHFIFARQPRQTTTHVMKNAARVAWHHTKKATQRHGETTKKDT